MKYCMGRLYVIPWTIIKKSGFKNQVGKDVQKYGEVDVCGRHPSV